MKQAKLCSDFGKEMANLKERFPDIENWNESQTEVIAFYLFRKGYYPSATVSIAENVVYGFGEPDDYGFFPITISKQIHDIIWEQIKERRNSHEIRD